MGRALQNYLLRPRALSLRPKADGENINHPPRNKSLGAGSKTQLFNFLGTRITIGPVAVPALLTRGVFAAPTKAPPATCSAAILSGRPRDTTPAARSTHLGADSWHSSGRHAECAPSLLPCTALSLSQAPLCVWGHPLTQDPCFLRNIPIPPDPANYPLSAAPRVSNSLFPLLLTLCQAPLCSGVIPPPRIQTLRVEYPTFSDHPAILLT